MANLNDWRRGEEASIASLGENYTPPTVTEEQNAALNDAAMGIDREAGTITDDRTGNTVKLDSKLGQTYLKQNTQNFEDANNPQPYDAPEGTHWDWDPYNRKWTLYKDFTNTLVTGGAGGGGGGGGGTTTLKTAAQIAAETKAAENKAARQSAYDLLYQQFQGYGLGALVEPLKALIQKDISPSQFTLELRNTPEYKKRFAANEQRIKAGFKALDEGTYLALEDSYQKLMQNYGLPNSYWDKGELGVQPGFEKLIAGNVDPVELENRLILAVDQIEKGPKEYMDAIKQFYPEISRSDLMAYVLDPANALKSIQSKVKTAQIGGEYLRSGLATSEARAAELSRQGVTADMARSNIPTIVEAAKRGGELSDIYARHGLGEYDQATAEEELYNLGKAAEAKKKRQQYTALETSSFSGASGGASGALNRDRAGQY